MSDTGTPAAPAPVEPTPAVPTPETPAIVTEVDIPEDGGFPAPEPEPAPETPAAAADTPPPEEPRIKKSPYQARIDALTAQRESEKQAKEQALAQAEMYKAMAEGKAPPAEDGTPTPQPSAFATKADFDKAVQAEAQRQAQVTVAKQRTDGLIKAGETDYKDFTDRCNVVAALGAGDRPDFMQIVTDPDIMPDGHKVIAQLADKPEEAARILALPTVQMTAALVKFQAEHSKGPAPKPISAAPAPIRTIDGQSRGNDEPKDSDDMATYAAKYKAQQAAKLKERQPSRFAKH